MTSSPEARPGPATKSSPGIPSSRPTRAAWLLAALPPLFWSGNFLIARVMVDHIPPLQMSFWRWLLAFALIAPFAARHVAAHRATLGRDLWFLALTGAIGITAFNCFIYSAMHHTTVVNAALINTLMPVVTILFAYLALGDRLSARQGAGVIAAFAGAGLIIARGDLAGLGALDLNRGDLLVMAGLTFWAAYTVLIRWRPTRLPLTLFLAATIGFGTLFHLPLIIWEQATVGGFALTWASAGALAYFAVFPSLLAYIFWNRAVAALGPGRTGMFMYLMPIFSSALGVWLLSEPFRAYHAGGIVLIFAGIAAATRPAKRP